MSGMAPAARIAVYKVLWENAAAGAPPASTEGIVAAIDDAVADGADVINYSISGSSSFIVGAEGHCLHVAADAGVFVSTSAGNSGDTVGTSSVAHNAPWAMTVAASTHDRGATKTVTLGDGATYTGIGSARPSRAAGSSTPPTWPPPAPPWPTRPSACPSVGRTRQPTLDPAKVAGKIVMCTRGGNDRVDKSLAVKNAGGIGMILVDPSPQLADRRLPLGAEHPPQQRDGAAVKAYIASAGDSASAAISAVDTTPVEAPSMGGFSSFGPALAGGGNLLKPDITAPGVGVIAAVAPPGNGGLDFNSYDGTSMSAPHITGIAALILQKHPSGRPCGSSRRS